MKRGQGTVMDDSANAVENEAAALNQLSLFDAVQPIPMNTNPTNIDEMQPVVNDAILASADMAPGIDAGEPFHESVSLGLRLREARIGHGLSVEDVAHQLKLPHTVIEALEAEHFDRIGRGIFLRGYLAKYLNLLDLSPDLAGDVLEQHDEVPPLVTSGMVSRPRYLFDRYSGSALYLILTGVIIVPAVLLAMHIGLDSRVARIASLDAPVSSTQGVVAQDAAAAHVGPTAEHMASTSAPEVGSDDPDMPAVMASMATFSSAAPKKPSAQPGAALPRPVIAAEPAIADDGSHSLHLQLVEPSWVEVVDGSGKQLEYALLPAGTSRDYQSKHSLNVLLGNATGASIRVDGKVRDLAPYLRGNVARFKLADGDWTAAPSGG